MSNNRDVLCRMNASLEEMSQLAQETLREKRRARIEGEAAKEQQKTRKVVYQLSTYSGKVLGPSYGRFYKDFSTSIEGIDAKNESRSYVRTSLHLSWFLNQPSANLIASTSTGNGMVYAVCVDEPLDVKPI